MEPPVPIRFSPVLEWNHRFPSSSTRVLEWNRRFPSGSARFYSGTAGSHTVQPGSTVEPPVPIRFSPVLQ
ncbi:hypothetical protein AMTR_s00138p00057520 [Amborella trichopoda]|uniref:Uncharacterized protein n=1 Tax=Amborella trichopoda TaxID=13333 RepID=W1NEK7_AMBTC|nr:hypothetical protein AMTR_s00138p00057520 [Amborella trichopoda]